jgi:hypothetical protein
MAHPDARDSVAPIGHVETVTALGVLRASIAEVALPAAASLTELETIREALQGLARGANEMIRAVDVRSADDMVAGQCFAARALVAEARRQLATEGRTSEEAIPTLTRSRQALYRALCLVARSLARGVSLPPISDFAPLAARRSSFGPAMTLVRLVGALGGSTPSEMGWALEVAECEIEILLADERILGEHRLGISSTLRSEASAWANGDRNPGVGHALLARVRALADELRT